MVEYKRMRMHPEFTIAVPDTAVVVDIENIIYWSDAFTDEDTFRHFITGFEKLFAYGGLMASDPAVTMYAPSQENADILFVLDLETLRGPNGLAERVRRKELPIDLNRLGSQGYGFPTDPYDILLLLFDLAESVRNVVFEEEGGVWWEEQLLEIIAHDTYRLVVAVNQAWLVDIGALERQPAETADEHPRPHRSTVKQ